MPQSFTEFSKKIFARVRPCSFNSFDATGPVRSPPYTEAYRSFLPPGWKEKEAV